MSYGSVVLLSIGEKTHKNNDMKVIGGRIRLDTDNFLLMSAEKFYAWLDANNEKARRPKKRRWNNGEALKQMGGFTDFINW